MSKEKLKSCPFCGGKVYFVDCGDDDFEDWCIECEKCHITLVAPGAEEGAVPTKEEAAKAWNRRTNDVEEELTEIQNIIPGTTIEASGIKMEILDPAYPAVEVDELGVLCLAKDILFEKAFDEENNNNWRESSLREYLNGEYKDSLPEELKEALLPFERDLMANDGLKAYGKCTDDVSLISEREYQDYREHISDKSDWWWTLTAWSAKLGSSFSARLVGAGGSLGHSSAYNDSGGVSPAFLLLPSLKVRIVEESDNK